MSIISNLIHKCAFTLIELLIAMTIFMVLIGITANLLATLSDMGDKSISIVEMHQQANELMSVFNIDMRNMHITTALAQSFEDPLHPHTTFMMNEKKEQGKAGGSYGPYSMVGDRTNYDFMWVRWKLDHMNGMLHRGRTRAGGFSIANIQRGPSWRGGYLHQTSANKVSSGLPQYHRFATPQTEYLYFEGQGAAKTGATTYVWNADAGIGPAERRRMYQHCKFNTIIDNYRSDLPMRWGKYFRHNVYTHSVVGNTVLLSEDCFAVKNQDGLTYNKDRLNLIGAPDETPGGTTIYVDQVRPLGITPNIECSIISYHLADGSTPVDDDSMADGSITIDLKGTGPQLRPGSESIINNRPDYAILSFLLHNIPEDDPDIDDIDEDPTTVHFINALRNKIHNKDGTPLTYANYISEMQDRQQNMLTLIEQNHYIGQVFHTSVAFPK